MSEGDVSNSVPSSICETSKIEEGSVNSVPVPSSEFSPPIIDTELKQELQQSTDLIEPQLPQKDNLEEQRPDDSKELNRLSGNDQLETLNDIEQQAKHSNNEQLEQSSEKDQELEKSNNEEQRLKHTSDNKEKLEHSDNKEILEHLDKEKLEHSGDKEKLEHSDDKEKLEHSDDKEKLEHSDDTDKLEHSSDKVKLEQSDDETKKEYSSNKEEQQLNNVNQQLEICDDMMQQSKESHVKEQPKESHIKEQPKSDNVVQLQHSSHTEELDKSDHVEEMEQSDDVEQQSDDAEQMKQLDSVEQQMDDVEQIKQSDSVEQKMDDAAEQMKQSDSIEQQMDIEKMELSNTSEHIQHSGDTEKMTHSDDVEQTQASNNVKQIQMSDNAEQQMQQSDDMELASDDIEQQIQQPDDMEQTSDDIEQQMQQPDDMEQQVDDIELQSQQADNTRQVQLSDDLSFDLISRQKLSLTPQSIGISNQEQLSPKGLSGVQVFEEDTRSSWSIESTKTTPVKEPLIDETSQNSVESQKSGLKRRYSDDEPDVMTFPPENVFEYMWPTEKGEFYFLQEQISDYLSIKSFKRKYPDLQRRIVDIDEKEFLRERGVVTETQCDLGLTALRSDDVLELMSRDYPEKYKNYIKVLREKEKQTMTEKQKEHISAVSDKNKMAECLRKAIKSASEYNAHLNQERREERRSCYDLQTYTIHYPVGVNKVKYVPPKMSKYPVALLPGQFQDSYKKYTPEELKYLPLNTVLYGPLQELKNIQALSDGSHSDSEDSSASDGSCSSSQGTHDDGSGDSTSSSERNVKSHANGILAEKCMPKIQTPYKPKDKPNAICKLCKLGYGSGKDEKNEPLIHCSQCEKSGHPTCLRLTLGVIDVLKTYPWQCMDCKSCSHCRAQNNKDKMLFCDNCDRGYHMFCIGLKVLPQNKWICQLCGFCAICGATKAGPDPIKAQWQYDIHTAAEQALSVMRRPKIVCQACFKRKR